MSKLTPVGEEQELLPPCGRHRCASHPEQWPPGRFDLIVCGEMGYYLGAAALHELRAGIDSALRDDGLLVACHWLPSFHGRASRTDVVHRCLGQGLHEAFHYRDADFVLQGWTRSALSLARNEDLR